MTLTAPINAMTEELSSVLYRPASTADELHLLTAFSRMLRELAPLGHDVLPTDRNVDYYYDHVMLPALSRGQHGIYLAFVGDRCVGASFFTPERSNLDTPASRAIAHGLWVDPDYRRQGIGGELQNLAQRALARLGCTSIFSTVLTSNQEGLTNCTRQGYKHVGYVVSLDIQPDKEKD